jgi:hypothetical protein
MKGICYNRIKQNIFKSGEIAMKIMAFNGSLRKKNNTATLLEYALKGACLASEHGFLQIA